MSSGGPIFNTGAVTDRYTLHEDLGSGNYSVVKLAIDKETGEKVACKVIAKSKLGEDGMKLVFQEIAIMKTLNHPHIVRLRDSWETPTEVHLIMDLVKGGELFDKIVSLKHYSEKSAAQLMKQMLEAIVHVHKNNVVHRDLKPENLLLGDDSDNAPVLVADFGLAEFVDPKKPLSKPVGTPGYVAPEVVECLDRPWSYSKEVDVWALGVILYIMLSGSPPFWAEDDDEVFDQILVGEYDFNASVWSNISESAKDLIRKMMTVDPKQRISASDALHHPWILHEAPEVALVDTKENLAKFNAKRKWKGAILATMAANRMKNVKANMLKMSTQKHRLGQN